MGAGKIAAQCGHATLGAYKHAMKRNAGDVKSWSRTGQAKIALKCPTLEEMHAIADNAEKAGIINYTVVDAGRTQIEEGTETVLAIGPVSFCFCLFHYYNDKRMFDLGIGVKGRHRQTNWTFEVAVNGNK